MAVRILRAKTSVTAAPAVSTRRGLKGRAEREEPLVLVGHIKYLLGKGVAQGHGGGEKL